MVKLWVINLSKIEFSSNFIIHNILLIKDIKFNLLNISQLYDTRYKVESYSTKCLIIFNELGTTILVGQRKYNVYTIDLP